jgi:hypothetical protein
MKAIGTTISPMMPMAAQYRQGRPARKAGEENADREDRNISEGGAEIGLFGDERHGDEDHAAEFQEVAEFEDVGTQFGEETGDEEDDDDFGEFGDLEVDAVGEGYPASGAERFFADHEDQEEEGYGRDVERVDALHHGVIVDLGGDPHKQDADSDVAHLLPPGTLPDGAVGGTEDLDDAERAD